MTRNKNVGRSVPSVSAVMATYITNKKHPVSWKELAETVQQERRDLLSKDIGATVRSVLLRDKRFVKTSKGMYDIKK